MCLCRLGFSDGPSTSASSSDSQAKYLDAFAAFRDEVRGMAKAGTAPASILAACDRVRGGRRAETRVVGGRAGLLKDGGLPTGGGLGLQKDGGLPTGWGGGGCCSLAVTHGMANKESDATL